MKHQLSYEMKGLEIELVEFIMFAQVNNGFISDIKALANIFHKLNK